MSFWGGCEDVVYYEGRLTAVVILVSLALIKSVGEDGG